MALINCPECGKEISDTIRKCIHCGVKINRRAYTKIGGWLILIIMGYVYQICYQIINLNDAAMVYTNGNMSLLSNPQSDYYDPNLFSLINFEIVFSLLLIMLLVVLFINMFSKKKIYPKLAIWYLIIGNGYYMIDIAWFNYVNGVISGQMITQLTSSIIAGVIWIIYFIKSERVKQVFVK